MRLKYNILAGLQVLFSLLFFFQLASVFGAAGESDSFLVSMSIIAAVQLLQLMFVEQLLFFYQQHKAVSKEYARVFYLNSLLFSVAVGVVFIVCFYLFSDEFIDLYLIFGSNSDDKVLLKEVFMYLCFGLIVYPATYVNDRVLNAEEKFALPYVSEMMPYIFMVLCFVWFEYLDIEPDILYLALSRSLGMFFGLIVTSSVLISDGFFKVKYLKLENNFIQFIQNSFMMRFSHNINNFGVNFIVNSFLLSLPEGFASIYHYALKGVTVIKQVIVGPLYRVFQTDFSSCLYNNKSEKAKNVAKKFAKKSMGLYVVLLVISWFLIEPVLNYLVPVKFDSSVVHEISTYFILIGFWHSLMVAELSRITLYMAIKDYKVFLLANSVIVFVLFFTVYLIQVTLVEFVVINIVLQACSYLYYVVMFNKKLQVYVNRNFN